MREEQIKDLLRKTKMYDTNYQRVLVKEFLIKKILKFIYTHPLYLDCIFTGGTCLRIVYDLPRLSEDIDIDIHQVKNKEYIPERLSEDLTKHIAETGRIKNISIVPKSQGRALLLKFPILKRLGLSPDVKSESDNLYVKIDLSDSVNPFFGTTISLYEKDGYSFFIKHYDLPSLFAGKLTAIFGRSTKLFHDQFNYKGRDFFDLIWYMKNKVVPNFERLKYELETIGIPIKTMKDFIQILDAKLQTINPDGIFHDLNGLIEDSVSLNVFSKNFVQMYEDLKGYLQA